MTATNLLWRCKSPFIETNSMEESYILGVNGLLNIENSARHVSGKVGIYIFDEALIIKHPFSYHLQSYVVYIHISSNKIEGCKAIMTKIVSFSFLYVQYSGIVLIE